MNNCTHLNQIAPNIKPLWNGCKECLEKGDLWVSLRLCLTCGYVGCCESSKNKHALQHFHETNHPIVQSYGDENKWRWCYIDQIYLD